MDIYLSTIKFSFKKTEKINFDYNISKLYGKQIIDFKDNFYCYYYCVDTLVLPTSIPDFVGRSFDDTQIPYEWKIFKADNEIFIHIDFFENESIKEVSTVLNFLEKKIVVEIVPHSINSPITIDPFFHPLGSLIMVYLSRYSGGFLVHASGINDKTNGYLFSGVSGVGKSTISQLWSEQGATIINDDRIWVQKIDNQWKMFNTPMVSYRQEPLMATLSKIFLISHSHENFITKISNAHGALGVMSNCIQHLFDKKTTASHLDTIFELSESIPIYKLGFKPTSEVVGLIRDISE